MQGLASLWGYLAALRGRMLELASWPPKIGVTPAGAAWAGQLRPPPQQAGCGEVKSDMRMSSLAVPGRSPAVERRSN
eukprot:gene19904-26607_t